MVSGRLGGAEMARSEGYSEGNVPLQTLRADIDYAGAEATTTYGKLGVKVWIYKGEILPDKNNNGELKDQGRDRRNPRNNNRPDRNSNDQRGGQDNKPRPRKPYNNNTKKEGN